MENKSQYFETNPIIAAVKDEQQLECAINSSCGIIFFLFGNICNIKDMVDKAKNAGKLTFVHLDLTQGLSGKEIAVDFVKQFVGADGVISTKVNVIKLAREQGLFTVQRFFIVDSHSLATTIDSVRSSKPDMIEIMPGTLPKVVEKLKKSIDVPIIAGGLIETEAEVLDMLRSGACIGFR